MLTWLGSSRPGGAFAACALVVMALLNAAAYGLPVYANLIWPQQAGEMRHVALISIGAVLASFMGTTGASMLMIRPLIRANDNRRHVTHIIIFFIFIVSNISGSLTPLGDPPLFLGFLKGVTFFWTVGQLVPETLFMVGTLLVLFFAIDSYWYRKEDLLPVDPTPDTHRIGVDGGINLLLIVLVAAFVLMSGIWHPGVTYTVFGTDVGLQHLVRDGALVVLAFVSLLLTPAGVRAANEFSWAPMAEVAKLFVGIFLTMMPVLAMLKAGESGAFSAVARAVTGHDGQPLPWAYFWFSGALSSFLDNAPTYLVFFNLAGGDPSSLMVERASTLAAISAGAVFMGANTYIGNAPNFMVKSIAEHRGIRMPSFFGYMLWSCGILLPLFLLCTFIWFH